MKKKIILLLFLGYQFSFCQFNFERSWGTYFGVENFQSNTYFDNEGSIYTIGIIDQNVNFDLTSFITPNAYQTAVGTSFIIKHNIQGVLEWGTYFNALIYNATVDNENNLIIIGAAGSSLATTSFANPDAYQPNMIGANDLFMAKFSPTGSKVWGTFLNNGLTTQLGSTSIFGSKLGLSIVTDEANMIYFTHRTSITNMATVGTFQQIPNGQNINAISKFSNLGFKVWSTYYGINGSQNHLITSNRTGIFVSGHCNDCTPANPNNIPNSYFATPTAFQPIKTNCQQGYISKFNFDGQRVWSTYFKVSNPFGPTIIGNNYSLYVSDLQFGNTLATPGAFQETNDGNSSFILKFNDLGEREWGTYFGLGGFRTIGKLIFDPQNNLYYIGTTNKTINIATTDGFLSSNPSSINTIDVLAGGYFVKFNQNGQRVWGSYYGGNLGTIINNIHFSGSDFYLYGLTNCPTGIATANGLNPIMPTLTSNGVVPFIAKFGPSLTTNQNQIETISILPNPSNGVFNISNLGKEGSISIYDVLGKLVHEQSIVESQTITISNVSKGIYFAKIKTGDTIYSEKILVE